MFYNSLFRKFFIIFLVVICIYSLKLFPSIKKENSDDLHLYYIYLFDSNNYISRIDFSTNFVDIKNVINSIFDYSKISGDLLKGFYGYFNDDLNIYSIIVDDEIKIYFSELKMIDLDDDFISYLDIFSSSIHENYSDYKISFYLNNNFVKEYSNFYIFNNIIEGHNFVSYFLLPAKFGSFNYYIPVAKYYDNNKSKIEVAIDEINSSSSYNSNFVNYLDNDLKLISYSIYDDYFILNLNQEVCEEVKYALSYSIKKNYSSSRIVFESNGYMYDYCFFDLGCV